MPSRLVHARQTASIGAATTSCLSTARSPLLAGVIAVSATSAATQAGTRLMSAMVVPPSRRGRYPLQIPERGEQPRAHADEQRVRGALLVGEPQLGDVRLREILADALQPLDQAARQAWRDLAVHEHDELAVAVEAAAQIVGGDVLAEVRHRRAVRQPAKALRDLEPIAVERFELDDAETIEPHQVLDALGIGEEVVARHRLEGPLAEAA